MIKTGLYEQIINNELDAQLNNLDNDRYLLKNEKIDKAEAPKILANYIASVVEKGLNLLQDNDAGLEEQVNFANKIIEVIKNETNEDDFLQLSVAKRAEQLLALLERQNSIHALSNRVEVIRPETSIASSSLFTGAVPEPPMYKELEKEILSCDRIDMLVSFIRFSGLRLLMNALKRFTDNGGKLRVITTSYMGATDIKAVEELRKLNNTEIKISYDTDRTRLHAKAYIFYRETGFTTAYVGSSNVSNAALNSGLEWNVKVTRQDLATTIDKISATFETYWNSSDFELYTGEEIQRLERALLSERFYEANNERRYTFDINPYSYQQEILDKLQAERDVRNNYRNLLVAATGTGKTVISAFDYKRYCKNNGDRRAKLLFVAHREEILEQSMECFRGVLKDANFGELFTGNHRPTQLENLFVSIQTLNSQEFTSMVSDDFYDFIIVDEFHHAAAPSYQNLLSYFNPRILLGLTATPERMDGQNILEYFGNRIAAEIRLPEAIERNLLCPFHYFGVSDIVDLNNVRWNRGGYDKSELSKVYTENVVVAKNRANLIIEAILKYVSDIKKVKGLGFCVSQAHAKFMADYFNEQGIPSICLTSSSDSSVREKAKNQLVSGEITFIFVVDLYNEGVDIPEVNTVLFLRPTESLTVFLQQLGRGLRLADGKECLTVLDFIGQANKKYNFESRFSALLKSNKKGLSNEVKKGFISLPKGCYIQLERKAEEYILDNIRTSFGTRAGIVSKIQAFYQDRDETTEFNLKSFVDYYHLDVREIYKWDCFSRLCASAGVIEDYNEQLEEVLTKAFKRICSIDSRRWIKFLLSILIRLESLEINAFDECQKRMLNMFHFTIWGKSYDECGFTNLLTGIKSLNNNPVLLAELIELLEYNLEHIDFSDENVDIGFDCPLDLHCSYTRDQIFVALDYLRPSAIRQGVKWLPDKKLDVFINTLNKADKDYSPTTMYNDYSINEWLFHWQSQSTTSETSQTGQRYITHVENGSKVLLFVREYNDDILGTASFTFLGTANYVKHEGSKPMNIIWKLDKPIPARFLKKTNKLLT